jgi:hypothetical protein
MALDARIPQDHIDNDHPFKCEGCGSCYRGARHAARCCKLAAMDLRDNSIHGFSEEKEAKAKAADAAHQAAEYARHHFECSCGESFLSIGAAVQCRKCRTYTEEGYCTSVTDRNTGKEVYRDAVLDLPTDAEVVAAANDSTRLTHNPFALLGE